VYGRTAEAKDLAHRDVVRAWEEAVARALGGEGAVSKAPRVKLAIAAPLAVGVTSEGEVLDAYIDDPPPAPFVRLRIEEALPPGLTVRSVEEVGLALPSLQADVRWSEYMVGLGAASVRRRADKAVKDFLALATLAWEHERGSKTKRYDLRAQVRHLSVVDGRDGGVALRIRLQTDPAGTGRPEQLVAALGLGEPAWMHRTALGFATRSAVLDAWRRTGRFREAGG